MTDEAMAMRFTYSPERGELAKALVAFQAAAVPVAKTKVAKVRSEKGDYTYAYADLADVIESTKKARTDAGLAVVQFPTGGAAGIKVVTTVLHASGQWMEGELTLRPRDDKPQTLGSLITYLRRYCYSAVLGICTEADDDGAAAQGDKPGIKGGAAPANKVKAAPTALMANATQIQQIHILKEKIGGWTGKADHDGHPYRAGLMAYKDHMGRPCTTSTMLTFEQASNFLKRMQGYVDAQAKDLAKQEAQAPIAGAMDREPGSDDEPDNDNGEAPDPGLLEDVRQAAIDKWGKRTKDLAPQWLQKEFGVAESAALSKMQATRALQMLLAGDVLG